MTARNDLYNASAAQDNYYMDNKTYTDSLKDIAGDRYNFFVSKDVEVQIISAGQDSYCMVAFHKNGNKKYQINGTGEEIKEISLNSTGPIKEEKPGKIPREGSHP